MSAIRGEGLGADAAAELEAGHHGSASGRQAELLAQPRARAEQPRQHRALLHAHHVRDFLRRIAEQDLQHQRLAVFLLEAEDGVAHLLHALVLGRREHGRLGGDERIDVGELGPLLLEAARKLAAHDREQPGSRLALVFQRIERLPRPQHRLLHHVLGETPVPPQPPGEPQQVRPQALAQAAETPTPVRFSVRAVHV